MIFGVIKEVIVLVEPLIVLVLSVLYLVVKRPG